MRSLRAGRVVESLPTALRLEPLLSIDDEVDPDVEPLVDGLLIEDEPLVDGLVDDELELEPLVGGLIDELLLDGLVVELLLLDGLVVELLLEPVDPGDDAAVSELDGLLIEPEVEPLVDGLVVDELELEPLVDGLVVELLLEGLVVELLLEGLVVELLLLGVVDELDDVSLPVLLPVLPEGLDAPADELGVVDEVCA